MDRPEDAARVERAARGGASRGSLRGGTSYFSIFSGGASLPYFCLSGLAGELDARVVRTTPRRRGTRSRPRSRTRWPPPAAPCGSPTRWAPGRGRAPLVRRARTREARAALPRAPRARAGGLRASSRCRASCSTSRAASRSSSSTSSASTSTAHRRGPDSRGGAPEPRLDRRSARGDLRGGRRGPGARLRGLRALRSRPRRDAAVRVARRGAAARVRRGAPTAASRCRASPVARGGARACPAGARSAGRRSGRVAIAEAGDLAHVYFLDEPAPLPLEAAPRAPLARPRGPVREPRRRAPGAARRPRAGSRSCADEVLDLADRARGRAAPPPAPAAPRDVPRGPRVAPGLGRPRRARAGAARAGPSSPTPGSSGRTAASRRRRPRRSSCTPRNARTRSTGALRPSELYRYFEEGYRTPAERSARPSRGLRVASGGSRRRRAPGRAGGTGDVRVMCWNVHSLRGTDGRHDPERIARVIEELRPDIAGLQEVGGRRCAADGPRDVAEAARGRSRGMQSAFGPTMRISGRHPYGNAVLSRHPIQATRTYDLSVPGREPRGCLRADVELGDVRVHFFSAHLGPRTGASAGSRRPSSSPPTSCETPRSRTRSSWSATSTRSPTARPCRAGCAGSSSTARTPRATRRRPSRPAFPLIRLDRASWTRRSGWSAARSIRSALARRASDHLPLVVELELSLRRAPPARSAAARGGRRRATVRSLARGRRRDAAPRGEGAGRPAG